MKNKFVLFFLTFFLLNTKVFGAASYRVNNGVTTDITEHSVCKRVTNSSGSDKFIPTNTAPEWSNFYSSPPPLVSVGTCTVASLTYLGSASSNTNAASFNFGNFTAAQAGLIVVAFHSVGNTSQTVTSVSIGGSAGTIHFATGSATWKSAIATGPVAAGAQNVTVTLSGATGTLAGSGVGVWLLTNYQSATPFSTALNGTTTNASTLSLNIPANGVAIFSHRRDAYTGASTWSSATQRQAISYGTTVTRHHVFADKASSIDITPHSETVTWGTSNPGLIMGASWK